jgi:hypothetical protein
MHIISRGTVLYILSAKCDINKPILTIVNKDALLHYRYTGPICILRTKHDLLLQVLDSISKTYNCVQTHGYMYKFAAGVFYICNPREHLLFVGKVDSIHTPLIDNRRDLNLDTIPDMGGLQTRIRPDNMTEVIFPAHTLLYRTNRVECKLNEGEFTWFGSDVVAVYYSFRRDIGSPICIYKPKRDLRLLQISSNDIDKLLAVVPPHVQSLINTAFPQTRKSRGRASYLDSDVDLMKNLCGTIFTALDVDGYYAPRLLNMRPTPSGKILSGLFHAEVLLCDSAAKVDFVMKYDTNRFKHLMVTFWKRSSTQSRPSYLQNVKLQMLSREFWQELINERRSNNGK